MNPQTLSVGAAAALGRERLAGISETPGLDTDLLLEHASGLSRAAQITKRDELLAPEAARRFLESLGRRGAGEPVAYITGTKAFRAVDLKVDGRVLVPRPETELLVEVGLAVLRQMRGERRVLDVGTGSGAVALALATEIPRERAERIELVASDISQEALQVAAENRAALGLEGRVALIESNLLDRVEGSFDLILANLPYLRSDQRDPSTAAEPELALYAGDDGLDQYRRLLPQAAGRLRDGGLLACEIDPAQRGAMLELLADHIAGAAAVLQDLAGRDRFAVAGPVDIVRTVVDTWPYGA